MCPPGVAPRRQAGPLEGAERLTAGRWRRRGGARGRHEAVEREHGHGESERGGRAWLAAMEMDKGGRQVKATTARQTRWQGREAITAGRRAGTADGRSMGNDRRGSISG